MNKTCFYLLKVLESRVIQHTQNWDLNVPNTEKNNNVDIITIVMAIPNEHLDFQELKKKRQNTYTACVDIWMSK